MWWFESVDMIYVFLLSPAFVPLLGRSLQQRRRVSVKILWACHFTVTVHSWTPVIDLYRAFVM